MNRDELDRRNTAAIARYARNLDDSGGRAPKALLDELWSIAVAFAAEQVAQHATPAPIVVAARGSVIAANDDEADPRHWDEAAKAAFVAADDAPPVKPSSPGPIPRSSARTRTRTRGNSG